MRFFRYFSIALILLGITIAVQKKNEAAFTDSGKIFGTYYTVKIAGRSDFPGLKDDIQKEFAVINQSMSVFEKNSEINKINALAAHTSADISVELAQVLNTALRINKESGGMFDPTVGKLVSLWGFGPDGTHKIPEDAEVQKELSFVGMDNIILNKQTLTKQKGETTINLSAIAKGYAVDRLAKLFKEYGAQNFMIDIGGEIYVSGNKSAEHPGWTVGVAEPSENSSANVLALNLTDIAVATSGNYRNFYKIGGKTFGHTISPKSGYPSEHKLASATVFSHSCMEADAYATAIMSMGEADGIQFADRHDIPAILFVRSESQGLEIIYSQAAKRLIGE